MNEHTGSYSNHNNYSFTIVLFESFIYSTKLIYNNLLSWLFNFVIAFKINITININFI